MKDITDKNFGLLIAYLLPGITALWGVSFLSPTVRSWFGATAHSNVTVGGFLYVTLAAVGAGMLASKIRWAVIDAIHHATGVHPPTWDYSKLQGNIEGFRVLVEDLYRYYQFAANSIVAILFTIVCRWMAGDGNVWMDGAAVLVTGVLFASSRDILTKYYARVAMLLGSSGASAPTPRSEQPESDAPRLPANEKTLH